MGVGPAKVHLVDPSWTPGVVVDGLTVTLVLVAVGEPQPMRCARTKRTDTGRPITVLPQSTADWLNDVKRQFRTALERASDSTDDVEVKLPLAWATMVTEFLMPMPKRDASIGKKHDVARMTELVIRALSELGVVEDERTVSEVLARKRFAQLHEEPGVRLRVVGLR